jgi:hypothetical protein
MDSAEGSALTEHQLAYAPMQRHPGYNDHEFSAAVEFAFEQWETLQNAGSPASAIARP